MSTEASQLQRDSGDHTFRTSAEHFTGIHQEKSKCKYGLFGAAAAFLCFAYMAFWMLDQFSFKKIWMLAPTGFVILLALLVFILVYIILKIVRLRKMNRQESELQENCLTVSNSFLVGKGISAKTKQSVQFVVPYSDLIEVKEGFGDFSLVLVTKTDSFQLYSLEKQKQAVYLIKEKQKKTGIDAVKTES